MSMGQRLAAAIASAVGLLVAAAVAAAPPETIDFVGQLTTAQGQPITQPVSVTFAIYDQPTGGSALWSEAQAVTPALGRFSVRLGSVQPIVLAFDVPYYVGVTVAGEAEMVPRFPLTAGPYARYSPQAVCMPGNLRACYTGPTGTLGVGACRPGQRACSGGFFGGCSGEVQPASESCNGVDDDCDGQADNGATCSNLDNATRACVAGACAFQACVAGFGNCDTNTANGCEANLATDTGNCSTCGYNCAARPNVATAACSGGECQILACTTGFGQCNSSTADGCETNLRTLSSCGACNVQCSLANATPTCSSGTCQISSCDTGFTNIDGNTGNGCETNLNTNPTCSAGATFLGSVSGDTGGGFLSLSGHGERWLRVRLTENDGSWFNTIYLSTRITLVVPSGIDYDLYVHCSSCGGPSIVSYNGGSLDELVELRREDSWLDDDSIDLYVEVRFFAGTSPDQWTLTIQGNVATSTPYVCP